MADLTVEPLKDMKSLLETDIPNLPKAVLKHPEKRSNSNFKILRDKSGNVEKIEFVEKPTKTLVCHDMKGGYLEDKFIHGCQDLDQEPYIFTYWHLIDIFVYFSHHFITIPPLGWIEAAHKNGVQILGTIITEFDPGTKICNEMLENVEIFAERCTKIAQIVGFDGWLLNIENSVQNTEALLDLVNKLTLKMHEKVPNSKVIWYDSVTRKGELKWQNELNELNSPYFDLCDGIFLNYTWTDENLANSILQNPTRNSDIYVGIDVFGRGCPGNGGFNCDFALTKINYHSLSNAIFAPGWTHEQAQDDFQAREDKFWSLLEPLLSVKGISKLFQSEFQTGSCQNSDGKWCLDLSKQDYCPNFGQSQEIFCDISVENLLRIEIEFLSVPKKEIGIRIIFDENEIIVLKKEPSSIVQFDVEPPQNSNWLRYIKFKSDAKIAKICLM